MSFEENEGMGAEDVFGSLTQSEMLPGFEGMMGSISEDLSDTSGEPVSDKEGGYTALYRKWRPVTFEEVRGQEHVTVTLQNQIRSNHVGHAYLFCGTRGTGKTSVAKIFARAMNCEHPTESGSPCNKCPSCRSILGNASMNVMEIDAASNNGVDSIRQIRDEVQYSPTEGNYKVYIIDEVHMLSPGAYNALLKTLEEPPSYVIFILATTEVHKLPITILSRCQRYDFKRITAQTIYQQLDDLCSREGVETEENALRYVAKAADGSMRDALSLLEQCIAFYFGKRLTYEGVLDVLGAVDTSVFSEMLGMVLKKDVAGTIHVIDDLTRKGRDLSQFVVDFIWYMRNLLLAQTAYGAEDILEMSADNIKTLQKEARQIDTDTLMRYIRILSELSNQIRYATAKRVLVEVALIKMMKPAMEVDLDSLMQRLHDIEQYLSGANQEELVGRISAQSQNGKTTAAELMGQPKPEPTKVEVEITQADYDDFELIKQNWQAIMAEQSPMVYSLLKKCKLGYQKDKGYVLYCDEWTHMILSAGDDGPMQEIAYTAKKLCGKQVSFTTIPGKDNSQPEVVFKIVGNHIPGIELEIEESEESEEV